MRCVISECGVSCKKEERRRGEVRKGLKVRVCVDLRLGSSCVLRPKTSQRPRKCSVRQSIVMLCRPSNKKSMTTPHALLLLCASFLRLSLSIRAACIAFFLLRPSSPLILFLQKSLNKSDMPRAPANVTVRVSMRRCPSIRHVPSIIAIPTALTTPKLHYIFQLHMRFLD